MIRKLYPGGKPKAFSISYDDGVLQDVRFVELLNKYGLKGTFNLNSGLMKTEFEWTHECGMVIKRLSEEAAAGLYDGHEVASHTLMHPYMYDLTEEQIMEQMTEDRANLEKLFGTGIYGFAVPFTYYSDLIAHCAQKAGFEYARCSEKSDSFTVPGEYYHWRAGKFHWDEDLEEYVGRFLVTDSELALCQIVGHSYDLDTEQMWDRMEAVFHKISRVDDVLPMTNLEIVRYVKAMAQAEITADFVKNNSSLTLWFCIDGCVIKLCPGEAYSVPHGGI